MRKCFDSGINRACGVYAIVGFDMEGVLCIAYGVRSTPYNVFFWGDCSE